jgi:LPS sulfotransferase NodH
MRRVAWWLLQRLLPAINGTLHYAELATSSGSDRPLPHAPVLILGAPRSGSTLLFQVLTEAFDFGYISNLHCTFKGGPSFVERLVRPLRWRISSTFTSRHGVVRGSAAPSECGGFWYRFFRRSPQYVPAGAFAKKKQLRAALRALLKAFGRPVLFKNIHCGLRLEPLAAAVPEALFIFITRDVVDNAHSLLESRREVNHDYVQWWSMEPPAIESLRTLPPEQQVVEQVRQLNDVIARQLAELHRGRFVTISYDELTARPHATVEKVAAFLEAHHARPAKRTTAQVPEVFPVRRSVKIETDLYDRLCAYAAERAS